MRNNEQADMGRRDWCVCHLPDGSQKQITYKDGSFCVKGAVFVW